MSESPQHVPDLMQEGVFPHPSIDGDALTAKPVQEPKHHVGVEDGGDSGSEEDYEEEEEEDGGDSGDDPEEDGGDSAEDPEDEEEGDLATANAWFSIYQRLAKENESIAALDERVSKARADWEKGYLDALSLLYSYLLFAHDQFCKAPRKARAMFIKLHKVGVLSAIITFLMPMFAFNSSRADELINMLMYARGKGVDVAGLRSFIMRHGGINECIEAAAGRSTL